VQGNSRWPLTQEGKVAATYGLELMPPKAGVKDVTGQEVMHGFIPRTTFVIDKNDKIVAIFSSTTDHISPDVNKN